MSAMHAWSCEGKEFDFLPENYYKLTISSLYVEGRPSFSDLCTSWYQTSIHFKSYQTFPPSILTDLSYQQTSKAIRHLNLRSSQIYPTYKDRNARQGKITPNLKPRSSLIYQHFPTGSLTRGVARCSRGPPREGESHDSRGCFLQRTSQGLPHGEGWQGIHVRGSWRQSHFVRPLPRSQAANHLSLHAWTWWRSWLHRMQLSCR